ncbi:MAG TPA: ABC transporter ATP-binding protein [Candidatus Paceibacterota bacterium]
MNTETSQPKTKPAKPQGPTLFSMLKPYRGMIALLIGLAFIANLLNLLIPKVIAKSIDAYTTGSFVLQHIVVELGIISFVIFLFTYLQSVVQTYASERVAKDLRTQMIGNISREQYSFIQKAQPSTLLTNLTADIDSIKMFVSQAIVSIISSLVMIVGTAILLLTINWKLALVVLTIIPLIGITFGIIFSKVKVLFLKSREVIDGLNKTINESILGAALIRIVNGQNREHAKFGAINIEARDTGMKILGMFATLIPIITFISGLGTLGVLLLGGKFVINSSMSLGDFSAFYTYIAVLFYPIIMIGFMSTFIAQATASFDRIKDVLYRKTPEVLEGITKPITKTIAFNNVTVSYGDKQALKDVSFAIPTHTKTAIIGPTAAGKTQLLYLLTGLIHPSSGTITLDDEPISAYQPEALHGQIGFVFQDSIIFNMSVKENIAFTEDVTDEALQKAIKTAELNDFLNTLPDGINTIVSERGTTLSGGQKQRIMLARALAMNPSILLLDDFTARVDIQTEQRILENIAHNYPHITLISVTQKIASIEHYDTIMLLMEGELLATGNHAYLMEHSPEYVQIYNSQQSTHAYELHA